MHIMRVNLTTNNIISEPISKYLLSQYVGGKGLGAAYLYNELPAGVPPLSPENKLLFMMGPLTGLAPGSSRYCVVTKSPLTGAFLHSYSGGHFPSELRFSLPDHLGIIFEGKAEAPVYLKVDNGEAELLDAHDLQGKTVDEVCSQFEDYQVACIGPAGENLVKFSTIATDHGKHHAGRGGAGAVMGSKMLKAVVVRGKRPNLAAEIRNLQRDELRRLTTSEETKGYRLGGTPRIIDMTNETGTLPTKNWTEGSFKYAYNINLDAIKANTLARVSCYNCPIACGFNVRMTDSSFKETETGKGPEYESLGMIGANNEIGNLDAVAKIAHLCNRLGMDTISVGNVIGWTMECSQKNLINYDISFGNAQKALSLVYHLAYREGIGNMLAEGTRYASQQVGGDAIEAAVEVKGLELPAYDPRGSFSMALAYATSDRGGCHLRAWAIGGDVFGDRDPYSPEEAHVKAVIQEQNLRSVVPDSLVSCAFAVYTLDRAVKWLNAFSYKIDLEELERIGERIWNLTRMFNIREGLSRKHDSLPKRLTEIPLKNAGPAEGKYIPTSDLNKMLDSYYEIRCWDEEGKPSVKKLKELEMHNLI